MDHSVPVNPAGAGVSVVPRTADFLVETLFAAVNLTRPVTRGSGRVR